MTSFALWLRVIYSKGSADAISHSWEEKGYIKERTSTMVGRMPGSQAQAKTKEEHQQDA
jgi:hypothetical protein